MAKKRKNKKAKKIGGKHIVFGLAIIFLAGIFLFGGKAQGLATGKLIAKGNFYFNGGAYDLDKAAKFYKAAAFVGGKSSYPRYQLARVYFLKTDYKDGLKEINKALALNPENKRAFYIRGLINGYAENYQAAAEDFQKFIAWAPKEWAGYNDLAWAYYEGKDYQNAVDAALKGLEVVPNNAWLLNGLGVSLQALGKSDEAKVALDRAAEIAKKMTPADWKVAYPGNDAQTAEWDLAQFKTDVNYNLNLTSNYSLPSSGQGKFQAACAASMGNYCSDTGTSCVLRNCEFDTSPYAHAHYDLPFCRDLIPCTNDCPCGKQPELPPDPGCYTPPNPACKYASCQGQTYVSDPPNTCRGVGSGDKCCVSQSSTNECPGYRCVAQGPCTTPGSCSISLSPNPVNLSSGSPSRTLTATRSDGQSGKAVSFSQSNSRFSLSPASCATGAGGSCSIIVSASNFSSNTSTTINATSETCSGNVTANITGSTPPPPPPPPPPPGPCGCGDANGSNFCEGVFPGDSELCTSGSATNKTPDGKYGDWTWKCCSGTVSCSAKGPGYCGWIETNP